MMVLQSPGDQDTFQAVETVSTEMLSEVTRRLAEEFKPEQVWLFGSYAWGTAITGVCPRRFSSSAIAIKGLMSPDVPMLERMMRTIRSRNVG